MEFYDKEGMNRIMGRQTTHNTRTYNNRIKYEASAGYYMPGSSAVAIDYAERNTSQQEQKKNTAVRPKRKSELLQWLATLTVVFAMGMALVGQYAYIGNLGYEVSQTKNELKTVQMQNEKMKNQISNVGGLQHIEMVAVNNMGMHKPHGQEIIYLSATE